MDDFKKGQIVRSKANRNHPTYEVVRVTDQTIRVLLRAPGKKYFYNVPRYRAMMIFEEVKETT